MSDRNSNVTNDALSDVEKFVQLLIDLKIIDRDRKSSNEEQISKNTQSAKQDYAVDFFDPQDVDILKQKSANGEFSSLRSRSLQGNTSEESILSLVNILESNISESNISESNISESNRLESLQIPIQISRESADNLENSTLEPSAEQKAIDLIYELLVGNQTVSNANTENKHNNANQFLDDRDHFDLLIPTDNPQGDNQSNVIRRYSDTLNPSNKPINSNNTLNKDYATDDDAALHLLQDILVVPEIEDLRSFKISVEQKLGIVESQVNSPDLMNKIKELENLVQNASFELGDINNKITEIGNEQVNIPTEIALVRERVMQLEQIVNDPDQLVQLLLPIIADLLSIKSTQSTEEMCLAITPIIAEVILERSQLDRVAMSHAIADILPNAISEQIRKSPQEIAKAIGPEMGAAIREQIRLDRDEIIDAIAPEMGSAIKRQIDLERDSMVDALYPVIGNTIAKYFAEAIRSINEKVEQTFSLEGIQRKVRAKMQGVSEAELIFKESASYEVQAIFLIHNLSGLVMVDIQQSDVNTLIEPIDSDMLAGMLTAIRSFANECMSRTSSTNTELDAINYSGSKILLEVAGYCYLAVIIRGEPDPKFVQKIRDVFGQVVQAYGHRLKAFDGDPSIIPSKISTQLKTLMVAEKDLSYRKSLKPLIFTSLLVVSLIFIPIGFVQYQSSRDREVENRVLEAFASTPELAVYRLNVSANGNYLQLSGKLPNLYLRDRAFQIANEITNKDLKSNQNINKINNNIYVVSIPPDPTLVAIEIQRLTKVLNYTQGVKIQSKFNNGQVIVTGEIEQPRFIQTITQVYTKVAGVKTVTNATTLILPKLSTRIYFPFGVTNLPPEELEKLVEIKSFLDLYPDYSIKIYAKSDNVGERVINYQFSIARIQVVRDALIKMGIKPQRLRSSGLIDRSTYQSSEQMERWVEFEPTLR